MIKKSILAAMSSYDEILTTQILNLDKPEHHIFKNQIEWIKDLIHFVKNNKKVI